MQSIFRVLGLLFLICGAAAACYYFFMFETWVYSGDDQVENIGLLSQRQNGIMFGVGGAIVGCFLMLMGSMGSKSADR